MIAQKVELKQMMSDFLHQINVTRSKVEDLEANVARLSAKVEINVSS